MDDKQIVELFWERSEDAITQTDIKYGKYVLYIADNVLHDTEDAKEVQNDTYLRVWETVPPKRPNALKAYVGCICRNLSISRYRAKNAEKRGTLELALDELGDCVPDEASDEQARGDTIADALNRFVGDLPARTRKIFVMRYWYLCTVAQIAEECSMNPNTVSTLLFRTRKELKEFLEKECIYV